MFTWYCLYAVDLQMFQIHLQLRCIILKDNIVSNQLSAICIVRDHVMTVAASLPVQKY